ISVTAECLSHGDGIAAGQPGEAVYGVHLVHRWQVDHALSGPNDVFGSLRDRLETQHATPPEPEGRRDGGEVVRAVLIERAVEDHGRAEIQNGRLYTFVRGGQD